MDFGKSGTENDSPRLKVAAYINSTPSEGPYNRFALWVQGCSIGCPGCCNPEMQESRGGTWLSVSRLKQIVLETKGIEGVTFLGGEPFDQAPALGCLAAEVKGAGLGVITFSGYEYRTLRRRSEADMLIKNSDLIIAGPYIKDLKTVNRRFIGSDNQTMHFLSDRYRKCHEFNRPGQSVHFSAKDAGK